MPRSASECTSGARIAFPVLMELLPKGAAKAKVIAAEISVSERILTRQLAALGTSFNEVLDRLRKQLALKYVREAECVTA